MLRQGDAKVFKKYSQMKLQMKREALEKINRQADEQRGFDTVLIRFWAEKEFRNVGAARSGLESKEHHMSGRSAAW